MENLGRGRGQRPSVPPAAGGVGPDAGLEFGNGKCGGPDRGEVFLRGRWDFFQGGCWTGQQGLLALRSGAVGERKGVVMGLMIRILGNHSVCNSRSIRSERLDVNGCFFLKTPDVELPNVSKVHTYWHHAHTLTSQHPSNCPHVRVKKLNIERTQPSVPHLLQVLQTRNRSRF